MLFIFLFPMTVTTAMWKWMVSISAIHNIWRRLFSKIQAQICSALNLLLPILTDHEELLEAAQAEIRTNARPEINGTIQNFDSYDVVFVGYPNWNADMPYIMYSFFENYDFSGKTIVPFMTHGGSGFSGTPGTIAELEPDATMLDGKAISRSSIEDAEQEIIDWIDEIGMLKTN